MISGQKVGLQREGEFWNRKKERSSHKYLNTKRGLVFTVKNIWITQADFFFTFCERLTIPIGQGIFNSILQFWFN